MANELTVLSQLHYEKNTVVDDFPGDAYRETQVTVTGNGFHHGVQVVATGSMQAVVVGSVTLAGCWLSLRNLDATNYVEWEVTDSGGATTGGTLKVGDPPTSMRINSGVTAFKMEANTAACNVDVCAVDA